MRFYNIEMAGKFKLEQVNAHPANEKARMYYHLGDNHVFVNTGAVHRRVVQEDSGTYAINISGTAGGAKYS